MGIVAGRRQTDDPGDERGDRAADDEQTQRLLGRLRTLRLVPLRSPQHRGDQSLLAQSVISNPMNSGRPIVRVAVKRISANG
jgi:hypothetical protein